MATRAPKHAFARPSGRQATGLLLVALLLSLLFNALSLIGFVSSGFYTRDWRTDQNAMQVTEVVLSDGFLEVVESFQESADRPPETADFASDRDMRADRQTSPDFSGSNIPQVGQMGQDDETLSGAQASQAPAQAQEREQILESFSLSEQDLVALNDPLLSPRAQRQRGQFSPGFARRLERGEELKVNAFGLDYGQYYVRMRQRLAQRWDWRRSLQAGMYNYKQISVTVAVVLNQEGQLEDIRVVRPSFFETFDQVAIEAFRRAEPFPNPPKSLIQDDNRVYIPWQFILTLDGFGQIQ